MAGVPSTSTLSAISSTDVGSRGPVPDGEQSEPNPMQTSSRLGAYTSLTSRSITDGHGAHNKATTASNPQGAHVWNTGNIWSNRFASNARDRMNMRENVDDSVNNSDTVDAKSGSGSLLPKSEVDGWSHRSPWASMDATGYISQPRRSSGVSPSRQTSVSTTSGSVADNATFSQGQYFSPRSTGLGHESSSHGTNQQLESPFDLASNTLGSYDRTVPRKMADTSLTESIWADSASVHSPAEDRRSVGNSEYYTSGSTGPSRSGSLPPSRHGSEPPNFQPALDSLSRFAHPRNFAGGRGHVASMSSQSNRIFPERTNSFPNETSLLHRPATGYNSNVNQLNGSHRPSLSTMSVGSLLHHVQHGGAHQKQNATPPSLRAAEHDSGYPQENPGDSADQQYSTTGSMPSFVSGDFSRASPGANRFRSQQFHSAGTTPPLFDYLYPSRMDQQTRSNSVTMLERRLQGLQREQQMLNPHFNPIFQANPQYRAQFGMYQAYQFPNGMPFVSMPSHPGLPQMPEMLPSNLSRGPKDRDVGHGTRSALLDEFKSNTKGMRRFELKDIYGHIVEFSGDQHGSRFIQQKLETANSEEKDRVFTEIYSDSLQLMQDVFGNYVIQKFFEHGDQGQKKSLANRMKGQVLSLSLQMYGCRVVQKALEHILTDQQALLISELELSVMRCVKDQNANHVIQKAIERIPAEHIRFILNAFHGQVAALSTHPYGCRVIQRMLEHCSEPARSAVLQELHACSTQLLGDQYGNYVTQHILEHGEPDDRAKIVELVKANMMAYSMHKFASNVVEKCLIHGSDEQRHELMIRTLDRQGGTVNTQRDSHLLSLIKDSYGNYVIQKFLDVLSETDYRTYVDALQPEIAKAKRQVAGKQVLAVEKKMLRFDVNKVDSPQLEMAARAPAGTAGTEALRVVDNPAVATPPPPLTADGQSLRSDSIPSTTTSAAGELVSSTSQVLQKLHEGLVPQISTSDLPES